MTQPANGNCARCNIILPTAATQALCDECTDTPEPKIRQPETTRPMRVVHNGLISKRNRGLEEMIYG